MPQHPAVAYLLLVRPMPDRASEGRTAERFARWLSQTTRTEHTVSPGDDPPDFLLHPTGWLEISDIYLKEEQAKFLNVPPEKSFRFSGSGPLDETALRLVAKLDEKLSKQSYARVYADRGKGILLLTCQDLLFGDVNLAQVHKTLASFRALNDRGFFQTAYFEYQFPGEDRIYEVVYSRKA